MQIDFLDDEFSLLVLLTGFIGLDVGPTDAVIAAFAEDVRDGVEAGDEWAVFGGTGANVYALVEEVGSSCVDCVIWFGLVWFDLVGR